MAKYIKNKKKIFLYLFLFLNPFLVFFNQNINKFNFDKFYIFFQIILFFVIIISILSFIIFFFFKRKSSFSKIFLILLIINFFSFFHHDLKMIIPLGRFSSEISLVFIILLSIIFIFSLNKNSILNHILFFLALLNFSYYFSMIILKSPSILSSEPVEIKNIDLNYKVENIENNKNIYLIINDEATSLELFEKYYNFQIKNEFLKELEKYNYEYVSNSKSSYNQTELTLTSIFYLDYFINHKSKKYKNTKNFYPQNLRIDYDNMPLIKLLNSINYKFYFIGNTRGDCETFVKRNCIVNKKKNSTSYNQHKSILEVFLLRSPYIPIYAKIKERIRRTLKIPMYKNNYNENDAITKFITNIDTLKYPKNSFFLIHNLYPHAPHIYNKDCSQKKIQREIITTYNTNKVDISRGYFENYLCSLKKTLQFIKYLEQNDKDAIVIFQGDHGKYFKKDNKVEKMEIFNLVKKSSTCNNEISSEIDNVNAVRYLIDCATKIKINLKEKESFWGPYRQTDKRWGKLFKID